MSYTDEQIKQTLQERLEAYGVEQTPANNDILVLISEILLTGLLYTFPFWLLRFIRQKPMKKLPALFIVVIYSCLLHVALSHIIYGYYDYSPIPFLWLFASEYFLVAKNPILIPVRVKTVKAEIINDDELKPHKKKFFRSNREKLLVGFIGLLLVGYFVSGYYFYSYYQTMEKENASLQRKLDDYTEVMERRADYGALKEKSDFFDAHAVFVGEDQYYYHTYDCPSRPDYFWIYNVNAAVGRGYHPCPTCKPPTSD